MADVLQGADVVHTEKLNYREALSKWNLIYKCLVQMCVELYY